jgi:hypothetical protein
MRILAMLTRLAASMQARCWFAGPFRFRSPSVAIERSVPVRAIERTSFPFPSEPASVRAYMLRRYWQPTS